MTTRIRWSFSWLGSGIKVGPTLGDSVAEEGVVRMGGKGILGGTFVVGVERRRVGGLFGRRGIT